MTSDCHWKVAMIRRRQKQFLAVISTVLTVVMFLLTLWPDPVPSTPPLPHGPLKHYVGFRMDGRLGNLMFEYAAMFGTAALHNMTPVIDSNCKLLNVFMLYSVRPTDNLFNTLGAYLDFEDFASRGTAYDARIKKAPHPRFNLYMKGYLQSFKYFNHAEQELKREFTFKPWIVAKARQFHANIPRGAVPVAIHVRRGDILNSYFSNYGYTTPEQPYFSNAMEYMRHQYGPTTIFVVCSDNLSWAKSNVQGSDIIYCPDRQTDVEDMAVLSLCKHTIVSEGSFGWWVAWLVNGTTIYYKNWPKPGSKLEYQVNKLDYFPKHWIKME